MTKSRSLNALVLALAGASGFFASPVAAKTMVAQPPPTQQITGLVTLRVVAGGLPVAQAEVTSGEVRGFTNSRGEVALRLPAGEREVVVRRLGYAETSQAVRVPAEGHELVLVELRPEAYALTGIVVTSTRTDRRLEDHPIRIEVLGREEIEEKLLMSPGDIAMLLSETSGLRVQVTSPSLGGANIRVQGLRGRYTQILSDGLPLYGGQTGTLGLLQIPPMDLAQVEVIKGAASSLYGASALGGVVNLISRRPDGERELLFNQTTRGGTDGLFWSSNELSEHWGYSFLGGLHRQARADVDGDGWADIPGYDRGVVRPRLFFDDGAGRSVFVTLGVTAEERSGGTLRGATAPDGEAFVEELGTRRADLGASGRFLLGDYRLLNVRGSVMGQRHEHRLGDVLERDRHSTGFAEIALSGQDRRHSWVLGAAFQTEAYRARDLPVFDYTHRVPALFAQDEFVASDWLTISASGRLDAHSEYGLFFNPRLAVLLRGGEGWSTRLSAGTGFFAPTPFTEETESSGLSRLLPLDAVEAERVRSASLDLGRTFEELELNATLFGSNVQDALRVIESTTQPGQIELVNVPGRTRTGGMELLLRYHGEPFHITATHMFLRSTEPVGDGTRREVPLTPRHQAGVVGMWEDHDEGRVGFEVYFTGRQLLEHNPYRETGRPHLVLGMLVERRFGPVRAFLNAENFTDTRLTRYHPLLRPSRGADGRWTTDAWAPLEGRVFNGGIRWEF